MEKGSLSIRAIKKTKETRENGCFRSLNYPYFREKEIRVIRSFLKSGSNVLCICGSPGCGKTYTVTFALTGRSFTYINYFSDSDVFAKVKSSKERIVVIDEYDKFVEDNKIEKDMLLSFVKKNRMKMITISNKLDQAGVLFFRVYSTEEMMKILEAKLATLGYSNHIEKRDLAMISKRFCCGDVRRAYDHCLLFLNNIRVENDASEDGENVHRTLVKGVLDNGKGKLDKMTAFSRYIKKCKEMNISHCEREDFSLIFDSLVQ